MTTQVGQQAPDFELPASGGHPVHLSDLRGKYVIIYFYPKDMTPACTTEACDFRDRADLFKASNAVIVGISVDPVKRHVKFIEKYGLPFMLLADEDHQAAERYGVWQLKTLYGKQYMGVERSTFLVDPEGILLKEWRKVRVKDHAEDVLRYLQELLK
ncbi:thioredoxin-dependent thiol peroxidase [Paenibacillus doosanensis]|uniref:thioredoxin-dependent peroxiredoxin n=1 Tax=Paenibacillus konkukensis TaxID=2020716 RepID=A0ABY4RNJ3_9BACL|nr:MULTISPECIES: thioredoxin-dependent thiol peroxidase [Paenibacillus]MCS7463404.1 thioredoxin-dependent thiol peroxidase [Paenibacillus doosanensis]UQZ83997.1 Putative peroxiredoxin bcp [Paenibacillus konkukensis]